MQRRKILIIVALIIIGVAWYLFRPERIFISQTVSEKFPGETSEESAQSGDSAKILFTGQFHGVAHETRGVATIHQLAGAKRVLRLTEFETSNGPDVHVYLVAAQDANDSDTVTKAGFIEIGSLKGNIGDQNYDLPRDIDLAKYQSVTIWCQRFGVNFGTAPLKAERQNTVVSASPVALYGGSFHSVAHETTGAATIYELPDGKRVLRFTEFETSNGPDVQVYLVAANDANDSETVTKAGFIHIGPLKGNIGDQNYELPTDVDLTKYKAVTVWCRRFGVNFGTAPLMAQNSSSAVN
jgi:hypothetical protein